MNNDQLLSAVRLVAKKLRSETLTLGQAIARLEAMDQIGRANSKRTQEQWGRSLHRAQTFGVPPHVVARDRGRGGRS